MPSLRLLESASDLLSFCGMDLAPALSGDSSSLKEAVIEVEAVDMTSTETEEATNPVMAEEEEELAKKEDEEDQKLLSEYETDSEAGSDDWETQSLYEDALQFVRDDQLREGGNSFEILPKAKENIY